MLGKRERERKGIKVEDDGKRDAKRKEERNRYNVKGIKEKEGRE